MSIPTLAIVLEQDIWTIPWKQMVGHQTLFVPFLANIHGHVTHMSGMLFGQYPTHTRSSTGQCLCGLETCQGVLGTPLGDYPGN